MESTRGRVRGRLLVLECLSQHRTSISKAAEDAGISLWEMLSLTQQKNVDWTGYDEEDLEMDLKLIE